MKNSFLLILYGVLELLSAVLGLFTLAGSPHLLALIPLPFVMEL